MITRFSSAGLIYKHFGREVITNIAKDMFGRDLDEKTLDLLYKKVYNQLILEIDAIDNGVNQADKTCYNVTTNLSSRVGIMNPPWSAP